MLGIWTDILNLAEQMWTVNKKLPFFDIYIYMLLFSIVVCHPHCYLFPLFIVNQYGDGMCQFRAVSIKFSIFANEVNCISTQPMTEWVGGTRLCNIIYYFGNFFKSASDCSSFVCHRQRYCQGTFNGTLAAWREFQDECALLFSS